MGEASKLANKLDTSATMWMVVIKSQSIEPGVDMKALYGTVKIASGNLDGDLRVITGDPKQASQLVTKFNTEFPKMQQNLPPAAASLAKSLKVTNSGAELQATASAPEKEVIGLLSMVLAMM
jgi:hypothetical protein